jgi:tetratricopeptide (TPR) repeat protein
MDLLFEERKLLTLRYTDSADGYMLSARALTRYGNREGARPFLEELVKRFPHDDEVPAALHLLSQDAITRGDLKAARELRAKANASARWRAFFDARRRQAIEHPNDPLPRFGVAALWMEVGEAQRACDVLDKLLLKAPEFARGHALRGDASRALSELDESLKSWSRALELDENLHAARLNRSILWVTREQWTKARADLELLVDQEEAMSGPLIRAHLELSRALKALGDDEGAASARAKYERLKSQETDK